MPRRLLPLLFCLLFALTGCFARTIQVDAISLGTAPFPLGSTFCVVPQGADTPGDDLEFREFANHVAWAIEQRGLTRVETPGPDTMLVTLGYRMSEPIVTETESQYPIRGRVGSAAHTYYYRDSKGRERSRTLWEPRYGTVGYETRVHRTTEYACDIEIQAHAPPDALERFDIKPGSPLWKIRASHIGSINDLRLLFPRMMRTMAPHLGDNTGQIIDVELLE